MSEGKFATPDNIKRIINPEGKENLTPTDILNGRKKLVNVFGNKIASEPKSSWTEEEKIASISYQTLTETLYKIAPNTKTPDTMYRLYERNDVGSIFELFFKYASKAFWIVFAIATLFALLKFVFQ